MYKLVMYRIKDNILSMYQNSYFENTY